MLTWAYDPRANFESQIVPFAKSGYEFFVCPGVNDWSRILPDFGDGHDQHPQLRPRRRQARRPGHAQHRLGGRRRGAQGRQLARPRLGRRVRLERLEDHAARISTAASGAVLFGEKGDHFGQAIELLAKTHRMAGMEGMNNRRFWQNDFSPRARSDGHPGLGRAAAGGRAPGHRAPGSLPAGGGRQRRPARRLPLRGPADGADRPADARRPGGRPALHAGLRRPGGGGRAAGGEAEALVRTNRDAHGAFGREFVALWQKECKPYALDWTTKRYAAAIASYDALLEKLADARKRLEEGKPLPRPEELGLVLPEAFPRYLRPRDVVCSPLVGRDAVGR